ncbi:hypothetical protein BJK06_15050 [Curtobacterium sp. BH-2-1-1]|nr:hypothetical protein BJK06_15050 [Curtobacterium sp. BH-2-1-1]
MNRELVIKLELFLVKALSITYTRQSVEEDLSKDLHIQTIASHDAAGEFGLEMRPRTPVRVFALSHCNDGARSVE